MGKGWENGEYGISWDLVDFCADLKACSWIFGFLLSLWVRVKAYIRCSRVAS